MGKLSRRNLALSTAALIGTAGGALLAKAQTADESSGVSKDILGVDCYSYPGDRAVDDLRSNHAFRVMGFYLSHSTTKLDPSWSALQRESLVRKDWGLFPIYVGEQGDSPPAEKGLLDGKAAAKLMNNAGFATGSVVYLDIEREKKEGGGFDPYLKDWMKAVRDEGFYPGFYAIYKMAPWLTTLSSAVWTVELPKPSKEIFSDEAAIQSMQSPDGLKLLFENGILAYDPSKHPHGVIHDGCIATQYLWEQSFPDVEGSGAGKTRFDLNWSMVADPSNSASIAEALHVPKLIGN